MNGYNGDSVIFGNAWNIRGGLNTWSDKVDQSFLRY